MTEINTLDDIGTALQDIRADSLRAAEATPGISSLEREEQAAQVQRRKDEEGSVLKAAKAGFGEIAGKIGGEAAIRLDAIGKGVGEAEGFLDTGAAIISEGFKVSQRFNDKSFDMRNDDALFNVALEDIESRGLDLAGQEAQELVASRSWHEYGITLQRIDDAQERMRDVSNAGWMGTAAYMTASMFDVDVVVASGLFSKLRTANKLKRLETKVNEGVLGAGEARILAGSTTRTENILAGAEAAAISGGTAEAINAHLDPTVDTRDVIGATIMSAGFGAAIGSIMKPTLGHAVEDIATARIIERAQQKGIEFPQMDPQLSVGAAAIRRPDVVTTEGSDEIFNFVQEVFDANPEADLLFRGIDDFVNPEAGPLAQTMQKYAQKAYEGIKKTPFISDYDRGRRDAGIIGQGLAYLTLESPVGQVVNNRSADAVADLIQRRVAREYAPNRGIHYRNWAADNDIAMASKRGFFGGHLEFGKEVQKYRATVHAGHPEPRDVSPHVKAASEDIDKALELALTHNKKYGVEGFEDVEFIKGHTPTRWIGEKVARLEREVGTDAVLRSLVRGIKSKAPDLEDALAEVYGEAILRSAKNRELGNPTAALMTVGADGRAALERTLLDMGIEERLGLSAADVTDKILFKDSDRGIAKSARRKIPIDMTTQIEGTNNTLLDLVDNDLYALVDGTTRGQSNLAGLSSVGIQQRDRSKWAEAAADDARARGEDVASAVKFVDDTFSYFGEGAFAGGVSQATSNINKLAILSYLPQLGVTQTAEIGVAMGVTGIKSWQHYAGKTIHGMVRDKDPEVMKSLHSVAGFIGDHNEFVRTDRLDDVNLDDGSHLIRKLNFTMDRGMRGLGHMSGFYKVNEFLQSVAGLAMNDYMIRNIRAGTQSTRLESMGVDSEVRDMILRRIEDGSIKFDEQGFVKDMGTEGWSADEVDLLHIVNRRSIDQTVQKPRRGDAHAWQYTELGALFSSLRSFVFTAAQKQLIRNARLADEESLHMLLTTTGTAALAYSAKEVINGRGDQLDAERIAKGAMNWSSLLSPALMAVEPVSYMLGADKIEGSPFPMNGWRYGTSGIIGLPPGLQAANQLAGLGRLPADYLEDGVLDRTSENALRAIPVLGRSYPVPALMEILEKDFEAEAK